MVEKNSVRLIGQPHQPGFQTHVPQKCGGRLGNCSTRNFPVYQLENMILGFIISAMIISTLVLSYQILNIDIWRHDSLYYAPNYNWQLQSEGRWLVYILFRTLKLLPGFVAWIIGFVCFFIFI